MKKFILLLAIVHSSFAFAAELKPLASIWKAVPNKANTGIIEFDMRGADFTKAGTYTVGVTLYSGEKTKCTLTISSVEADAIHELSSCDLKTGAIDNVEDTFGTTRTASGLTWFSAKVFDEHAGDPDADKAAMVEYQ